MSENITFLKRLLICYSYTVLFSQTPDIFCVFYLILVILLGKILKVPTDLLLSLLVWVFGVCFVLFFVLFCFFVFVCLLVCLFVCFSFFFQEQVAHDIHYKLFSNFCRCRCTSELRISTYRVSLRPEDTLRVLNEI